MTLILAYLLVFGAVTVTFFLLKFAGLAEALAGTFSGVMMAGVPSVHKKLKLLGKRSAPPFPGPENFGLSPALFVGYGIPLTYAVSQTGPFVAGAIGGALGSQVEDLVGALIIGSLFISMPLIFLAGRWLGWNSRGLGVGLGSLFIVLCLTSFVAHTVEYFIMPSEAFFTMYGEEKTLALKSMHAAGSVVVWSIPLSLGFWRGRMQRPIYYLRHLIKKVPRPHRREFLQNLYEASLEYREKMFKSEDTVPPSNDA